MPTPHYGQPRYHVIADALRERIESGVIPPGTLLPTESALTAEFRAARGTIRQAIGLLRETGWVSTEHGRGTYANLGPFGSPPSETSELRRRRRVVPDRELATLFAVDEGATLLEEQFVTKVDGNVREVVRRYRLTPPAL
ncbi:GntR family transcriptional regulator [Micromonospora sp. NPDC005979]|uniref:GntR family transcriptional regulator n=1 Tax=Micromonospora sp. NPDC005979 TaxID=3156726 RepID=UPI0033BC3E5F